MTTPLRVLILEDRAADAQLMLHALHKAGFEPTAQVVATRADFVAQLHPDLDVILADYTLPQFNALEALGLLRASGLRIPFIIVTGTISEETAVECMKQGAADYLLKDRLTRLGSAVEQALAKRDLLGEKRKAEEALRDSERHFRTLTENASDIILVKRADGTITYASPSVRRVLGYAQDDLIAESVFDLIHPDALPGIRETHAQAFENLGVLYTVDVRMRHADGTWRTFEARGKTYDDASGVRRAIFIRYEPNPDDETSRTMRSLSK